MKFTIVREEFLKGLLNTFKIILGKNSDPILNNVKLDLFEDRLEIVATNGEMSIKSIILKYKDDKTLIRDLVPGSILINARMITEIIRKLDSDEVNFVIEDSSTAKIQTLKSTFNLNVIKASEYRELDFDENGEKITLSRNEFTNCISQTSFSASNKDNRPVLQCVNIESDTKNISFTATDGARLGRRIVELPLENRFSINVPAKSVNEVVKSLNNEKEIEIFISEKKVLFKLEDSIITSTIVAGDYPNTKNIIPHNYFYRLEVNSNEFLKTLDRIVIFSIDRENIVKLTMNEDEVNVSSRSQQVGDAKESLQLFKYSGDRLQISFNVDYVSNAIRALKSDDVVLSFLGEMKPFTITRKDDDKVIQLITPVRTY